MHPEWISNYAAFEEYCLANGWKEGLQVHRINNDGNYEPGNLAFVTPQEHARLNSRVKLSEDKVKEIFVMRAKGMTQQAIADHFDIPSSEVCRILKGQVWKGVEINPELLKGHPEVNPRAIKHTPEFIREVHKAIHFDGLGCKKLAQRFGLKSGTISNIRNGKVWNSIWQEFKHLTPQKRLNQYA